VIAALAVAINPAPLTTDHVHHHHRPSYTHRYPPCRRNMNCVVREARRHCLTGHDPRHCRLWHRFTHAEHLMLLARRVTRPDPPPAAPPAPAPAVSASTGMTSFDWCVSGLESGHGENLSNGYDFGWYQFAPTTYAYVLDQMQDNGISTTDWDRSPLTAPVWQQTAAFNFYEPRDPGAWPNTVPACGG
jgi:hypothetical protein